MQPYVDPESAPGNVTCLVVLVEVVIHEPGDNAGFAHALVSQEHQLVLCQRRNLNDRQRGDSIQMAGACQVR